MNSCRRRWCEDKGCFNPSLDVGVRSADDGGGGMRAPILYATLAVCATSSVVAVKIFSRLSCADSEEFIVNTMYEKGRRSFQGTFRLQFSKPLIFVLNETVLLHPWLSEREVRVEVNFTRSQRDYALTLLQRFGNPRVMVVYYLCSLDISCDAICTSENKTVLRRRGGQIVGKVRSDDECHGYGLTLLSESAGAVKTRWLKFCQNVSSYLKTGNVSVSLTYEPAGNMVLCTFYTVLPIPCILYLEGLGTGLQNVLCVQYAKNMTVGATLRGTVELFPTNVTCWAQGGNVYQTDVARLEIREPPPTTIPTTMIPTANRTGVPTAAGHLGGVGVVAAVLVTLFSVGLAIVVCAFRQRLGLTCLDRLVDRARYRLVRVL